MVNLLCVISPRQIQTDKHAETHACAYTIHVHIRSDVNRRLKGWRWDANMCRFKGLPDRYVLSGDRQTERRREHVSSRLQDSAATCQPWNILIIRRPITLALGRTEQKLTLHFPDTGRWPWRRNLHRLSPHYLSARLEPFTLNVIRKKK